jgi:hypothetical protein
MDWERLVQFALLGSSDLELCALQHFFKFLFRDDADSQRTLYPHGPSASVL